MTKNNNILNIGTYAWCWKITEGSDGPVRIEQISGNYNTPIVYTRKVGKPIWTRDHGYDPKYDQKTYPNSQELAKYIRDLGKTIEAAGRNRDSRSE